MYTCFPIGVDLRHGFNACRWRDCFSDEHYFATLLAVLGKENETDCKGFMMHVDWSRGGAHPRTYELREISAARWGTKPLSFPAVHMPSLWLHSPAIWYGPQLTCLLVPLQIEALAHAHGELRLPFCYQVSPLSLNKLLPPFWPGCSFLHQ